MRPVWCGRGSGGWRVPETDVRAGTGSVPHGCECALLSTLARIMNLQVRLVRACALAGAVAGSAAVAADAVVADRVRIDFERADGSEVLDTEGQQRAELRGAATIVTDARDGKHALELGGARNLGTIVGVCLVYLLARLTGSRYDLFYLMAAVCAVLAGVLYLGLRTGRGDPPSRRFVFRKEYRLFYAISALFGIRKQMFIVFGSWVLVSLHDVPVSTIALLYFIAATLGVVARPLLGDVIDWLGERIVLAVDEVLLLLICLAYAFASDLLRAPWDLYLLYGAYVFDIVLFALRVARTTYLKKIARDPADITPTISLGITIDHAVAMSLPVLSGYIWEAWGFRWVFLLAGAIALAGFFICLRIKVPASARTGNVP